MTCGDGTRLCVCAIPLNAQFTQTVLTLPRFGLKSLAFMATGWLEQGKFMAMAQLPTDHQLIALQSVEQSSTGIDAIPHKSDGLECVRRGWLRHRAHRREEGGLTDVWDLTQEGRELLDFIMRNRRGELAA